MNTLNPAMSPVTQAPAPTPQTPQSRYLQAALQQLSQQPVSSGAQLGTNLLASALMQNSPYAPPQAPGAGGQPRPGMLGRLGGLLGLGQAANTVQGAANSQVTI